MALVTYHLESVVSEFNIQDSLQILSKKKKILYQIESGLEEISFCWKKIVFQGLKVTIQVSVYNHML